MPLSVIDTTMRTLVKTTASGAITAVDVSNTEYLVFRVRNTTASGGTKAALRIHIQGSIDNSKWTAMPSGGTWPYMYKLTKFNKTSTGVVNLVGVRAPFPQYLRLYCVVSGGSGPAWTIEAKAQFCRPYQRVD